MTELRKSVKRFIRHKRSPKAEAIFSLCLQSFHEFSADVLSVNLFLDTLGRVSPTSELYELNWLTTSYSDRWASEYAAIEWAYERLKDNKINVVSATPMYSPYATLGPKATLHARNSIHRYSEIGQEVSIENLVVAPFIDPALDRENVMLNEELMLVEKLFSEEGAELERLWLWQKSVFDMAANKKEVQLQELVSIIRQSKQPVFTFSASPSQIYVQMASQALDSAIPDGLSDIDLLTAFMPWGSRTALFDYFVQVGMQEHHFRFCYLRPFTLHPPVRVEFLVVPAHESHYAGLLDMVMANFILNPDLL